MDRNSEIVHFFYAIFGRRVHDGYDPDDARRAGYDAVTLRYGISKGRLLNIISEKRSSPTVNETQFRESARNLISCLGIMNEEQRAIIERNEKLIHLLEECIDG